ncbi:MAG: AMP-binding protein [Bauldia sp.]
MAAENVGAGQPTLAAILEAWRKSPGHNANLLLPDVSKIGIALALAQGGRYKYYWSLVLGERYVPPPAGEEGSERRPADLQKRERHDGADTVGAMILSAAVTYEELVAKFSWAIPARFNIGAACVDAWATREPGRVSLIACDVAGGLTPTTYGELKALSDRLAHALRARGIGRGDRVALLLPQSGRGGRRTHRGLQAGRHCGALAALFGSDALRYRLVNSGAQALLTDAAGWAKVAAISGDLAGLGTVLCTDGPAGAAEGWREALEPHDEAFSVVDTGPTIRR